MPGNKSTGRNYRKEYDEYHGTPAQRARRSARNKARRKLGLKVGDPRHVDHVKQSRTGKMNNSRSNLKAVSAKKNLRKQPKRS